MKNLIIIFSFTLVSCSSQTPATLKYIEPDQPIAVELGQRIFICDSTVNAKDIIIAALRDSLKQSIVKNDSLHKQLFLANFKTINIIGYCNICIKNPSQIKFLKGWINRATK